MNLLSGFVKRLPVAMKVKAGLQAVGYSSDDLRAIDLMIAELLDTPLVGAMTGKTINSLGSLVDAVSAAVETAPMSTERIANMLPVVRPFLSSDAGREHAAAFLVKLISSMGPNKDVLTNLLSKLAASPLFEGMEFANIKDFLHRGALPMLNSVIPATVDNVKPHECSLCGHVEGN